MAKILIIDDRPINRQFLTTLLSYQHHELREASDGAEGLRVAREQRPDLIISDVLMPTMDGYEFVRCLREEPEIDKTPVIFSTAHYLTREATALAEKCGVTSIIFKPCELQVVLDSVTSALAGSPESKPAAPPEPEQFDREHQQLLINKLAEKTEQLRDAHGKLTALMELSTELAVERDPVELLDRYCSVAREVIGARWTLVAFLDGDGKVVQHLGAIGLDLEDSAELRSALLATGIFKTVISEGRTICLSDVTSTPAELHLPQPLPRAASLLVAPLAMRGQVYGWICLADKLGLDTFSEQDQQLAMALAAKMAVAYDNARLYSDSLTYVGKLEVEISERERAEEQLRLQSAALESAANAIVITDAKGKIIWVNPAFAQTTGYSFEEAVGKNPRFLKSGKQSKVFYKEMWDTILSGKVWRNTIINRCKDGSFNYEDLTITPILGAAGKITHFIGIKQDITERTKAEAALRRSERRFRALIEHSHDAIALFRADGLALYASPSTTNILGYSPEDILQRNLMEFVRPDCHQAVKADLAESLSHPGVGISTEGYVRHKDGRWRFLEGVFTNLLDDPNVGAIVNNYRDVTERKRDEEAIRSKSEELTGMTQQLWQASKLATMGELSASIAHELNNPLATVGLRTENLLMQLPADSDQRKPLEIIAQEVDRMANLVNNLLQFSRRSHRQVSTVDPREEIATSVEFVHYHLRSHNIEVVHDFADDLPTIQADRQQLRQLFLNLLTNASDAMPQGGKLTVRATSNGSQGAAVAIDFADTGEGISAENLEKIWEPFFTTKPEGKGTGLGLAICRRIVEEHGGTLDIQSEGAGCGTTVHIVLPATSNVSSNLS